jgi:hypothetical protein
MPRLLPKRLEGMGPKAIFSISLPLSLFLYFDNFEMDDSDWLKGEFHESLLFQRPVFF